MSRYSVILTRDTTESTCIEIEAESAEEANEKALQTDPAGLTWTPDDGNIPQPPYLTGTDLT